MKLSSSLSQLDDKAVQHREVQGHESKLFRSYFSNRIVLLKGGWVRHTMMNIYKERYWSEWDYCIVFLAGRRLDSIMWKKRSTSQDYFIL